MRHPAARTTIDDPSLAYAGEDFLIRDEEEADRLQIDLRAVWAAIYRNRWIVLGIVATALLVGLASILVTPRLYSAHASVEIDQQTAKVLGTEDTEPLATGSEADRFLQTQVDIIESRSQAARVAEDLGLSADNNFLGKMGVKPPPDSSVATRTTAILGVLQANLRVTLPRNSRVIEIQFESRDPATAARVANSYSKTFIASNVQRKFSTTAYSRQFLQDQLAQAKERLERSERDLIGYARDAHLIDASAGTSSPTQPDGGRSLTTSNLVQINNSYAAAQSLRLQAQQRWEQAARTPMTALPEVLGNPTMQQLMERRAELSDGLAQLRQRVTPDHPLAIQAVAQIGELDKQINMLAEGIRNSIRGQYQTALRQEQALAAQVQALKGSTLSEQDRGVRYNILKREVDTNRQLYESLLQRYKELSAEAGVATNNISAIDGAEIPSSPTSPRARVNLTIALLGGLTLALLAVFLRERLDDSVRDPRELEMKLHIPLLGVVPDLGGTDPAEALSDARSHMSEAYHSIRASIELSSGSGLITSLLVTSSRKAEGKSTTSFALARDFAGVGRRTLLIDADLRKPSLHKLFGRPMNEPGLSSVLARQCAAGSAVQPTAFENLSFMPSGPLPPDAAQLFGGASLDDLLATLAESYDIVLLDGPPVLALADATQLAAQAQATIFVVEAGAAHFGQARHAVRRLLASHANLIGGVVTKFDGKRSGYGPMMDYYTYNYYNEDDAAR